jgi:hypothetical protein
VIRKYGAGRERSVSQLLLSFLLRCRSTSSAPPSVLPQDPGFASYVQEVVQSYPHARNTGRGSFAGLSLMQDNIVVFEVVIIAIDSIALLVTGVLLSVLFRRASY